MRPEYFIPFALTLAPVLVVLIALRYRYLQTQARYRTLLDLAEKGVELPAQLLVESNATCSERRRALILIGSGLGIIAMFIALPGELDNGQRLSGLWGIGLLPLMIGLGYLASWWLNRRGDTRG
ncbi:MAG TPA: DUF6249 domain-containing protein [Rhodanobacteraceae bacterium]|jgi:hypothetical protein|nr:DUF6249 domain-containing protein [Rhodanobacteraceae bacterium]